MGSKAKHTTQSKIDQNKILHRIDLEKITIARQIYIALLQAINELEFMILVYSKNDFYSYQAKVVCQFTASSPAANSTGWSCLPIRFKWEIFTLFIRTSKRTVTFALNKVFQTRSAVLNDEYLLRDIAIEEYLIFIFI